MSDQEKARAQAEAVGSAPVMTGADRARFWAALNRYLTAEAEHVRSELPTDNAGPDDDASRPQGSHDSE